MKIRKNQSGFSAVELIIVIAVVATIGFLGYSVYSRQQDNKTQSTTGQTSEQSPTANDVKSAPAVNTSADLDKAQATLDQTDPSSSNSDANKLDSELTTL